MSIFLTRHSGAPVLAIICTVATILNAGFTRAQEPVESTSLSFRGKATPLRNSFKLPLGHYTGESGVLIIDGGRDRRCTLDVVPGTVLEDLKLHVREGAELTIHQSLLRRCHIYGEPKSTVLIEGSGLDHCELSGFGDSRRGYGTIKLVNTVLTAGACLRALNWMGADMQDCLAIDFKAPRTTFRAAVVRGSTLADLARTPSVRYTTFSNCTVDATLFFTVSNCTFSGCTVYGSTGGTPSPTPASDIALPVRWVNSTPPAPPVPGSGVKLALVQDAFPGGCKVQHEWDGKVLTMTDAKPAEKASPFFLAVPNETPVADRGSSPSTDMNSGASGARAEAKLKQTHVNGLLVMPLPSGKEAGQVSKMNLTVMPGASYVRFSQHVGSDMETALREVQKFMRLRHKELPADLDFEIAFEEKYSGKDGPSAAVACALLIESSLTGMALDPAFAVTGDMNADGSVQPIGGVSAKIRGATNGSCRVIAIPAKNERAASDILVRDGPGPLANITVFALSNFEEALALAATERTGPIKEAVAEMEVISTVLKRDPRAITAILRTQQAVARLQAVLAKAPHCISAKYLLLYAQGLQPTKLSLSGSVEAADADAQAIVNAISKDTSSASSTLQPDELGGNLNRLRNLRPMLDQRVWPYVDGLVDFGDAVRTAILNPPKTYGRTSELNAQIRGNAQKAVQAKQTLLADPIMREEMGF